MVVFFSSQFLSNCLQLNLYYPKFKLLPCTIGLIKFILDLFYLVTDNFIFLVAISILVFGVFLASLNATFIKLGGFIEMIVLSLAVIYGMKVLKKENRFMQNKIVFYDSELKKLVVEVSNKQINEKLNFENSLSLRKNEIFELIFSCKSD
jgi:uncharacterized membrane protein YdbT with pleckstrin-like domain